MPMYKTNLPSLKLLLIADLHAPFPDDFDAIKKGTEEGPNAVLLLGDINRNAAEEIVKIAGDIPVYYVLGNHDHLNEYDGIEKLNSLDGESVKINDVVIGGVSGSPRYKPGKYAMRSEEEVEEKLKELGPVDILISHETPYHFMSEETSHSGYKAITNYLKNNNTKVHFFGHHHWREVGLENGVIEYGIYKAAIYTTDGNIRHII